MAVGPAARTLDLADYPTGDGKPMAETPLHGDVMVDTLHVLRARDAGDPTVYIASNMMMYYVEGDKRRHISPDVYVTFGIGGHYRDAYFTWVEGKGPDVVFEITSPSTRREDRVKKHALYQDVLKVPEYFLFDPRAEYLKPPLQGYRLRADGRYERIEPDADGRLESQVLGLLLERDGRELRLVEPATGRRLLTKDEAVRKAEGEARSLADRLRRADEEVAALRRRLNERSRASPGRLAGPHEPRS